MPLLIASKYRLNPFPQRVNGRGRLFVSRQCDGTGRGKNMKGKHHFEGKMELSETLPQRFIISPLFTSHFTLTSCFASSRLWHTVQIPSFNFNLVPGEKRGRALLRDLKWVLTCYSTEYNSGSERSHLGSVRELTVICTACTEKLSKVVQVESWNVKSINWLRLMSLLSNIAKKKSQFLKSHNRTSYRLLIGKGHKYF